MKPRALYVMRAADGALKVGMSADPNARVGGVSQSGRGAATLVHCTVPVRNPTAVERSAHIRLKEFAIGKEWFNAPLEKAIFAVENAVMIELFASGQLSTTVVIESVINKFGGAHEALAYILEKRPELASVLLHDAVAARITTQLS